MSIFKKVMGDDFERLHPMLQKRYDLPAGAVFKSIRCHEGNSVVDRNGFIQFFGQALDGNYFSPNKEKTFHLQ